MANLQSWPAVGVWKTVQPLAQFNEPLARFDGSVQVVAGAEPWAAIGAAKATAKDMVATAAKAMVAANMLIRNET